MLKRTVTVIHNLRIFFLTLILVSFLALIGLNPINLAQLISTKIGLAVDMVNRTTAKVEPNPYNTVALQLKEKESTLGEKEKTLNQKEADLLTINAQQNKIIIALAVGIFILFALIITNYYLDYRRRKKENL